MLDPFTESSGTTFTKMNKEIWKDILGWEGLYQVSNKGRVKSMARFIVSGFRGREYSPERILTPITLKFGYKRVVLHNNGLKVRKLIHRLVAEAFIDNPHNKPEVDHIDCNPGNNCVENLRWCTRSENQLNPITSRRISENGKRNGFPPGAQEAAWRSSKGRISARRIPVARMDKFGTILEEYSCATVAARMLGLDNRLISMCCHGKRKTTGGYYWKFIR